ncbi:LytTR family transcriptional regulator DNA-binding domain-containing protein [Croceimicrobium hydrocarbonivorans]|uniref:LytTR family transcriptional regulator DNA-binding domain-containing protein n=1 Tax=Croceimicrobium hydrocarbonivorans TaxID=2761580 RepID=A0A7H0VFW5_9FLAO|nr:LytTR family transcriptional regulator DNA-binding domain-containing protein [Croceimicrobium hydrocarbonivorans]QNR24613.1 LytTR family transcriptional regulator DNA-binding domain-containing protein [Croceimicrobium hydrocarbonivorans]
MSKEEYSNRLWIADQFYKAKSSLNLRSISEDPQSGEIYLIYQNPYIEVLDSNLQFHHYALDQRVLSACNSADSGWFIGSSNGLYHLDKNGKQRSLSHRYPGFQLPINQIAKHQNGYLFCSQGNGLIVWNADSVFSIRAKDGLISDFLENLYIDNENQVWLISKQGFSRIQFDSQWQAQIRTTGPGSGLPEGELRNLVVDDNLLWFTSSSGLYTYAYTQDTIASIEKSFLHFKSLQAGSKTQPLASEELKLGANQNKLNIQFEDIFYRQKGAIQYRYRLKGLEEDWHYSKSGEAIYPEIPPGSYSFEVESNIANAGFKGHQGFSFNLAAPFYQQWWFYLLEALALASVLYAFFKVRILIYNRDLAREILRFTLRWLRRKSKILVIQDKGQITRIPVEDIWYLQASANYVEIVSMHGRHSTRGKISEMQEQLPEPLEFLRVHRSYIVRLDKIYQIHPKQITLLNGEKLPLGSSYQAELLKQAERKAGIKKRPIK